MAEAVEIIATIDEAMGAGDVEAGVIVGSTLTIGTEEVCFVVPTLSHTCHAIAGIPTQTVPTVSA